jgi:hypothetical protein
MPMADLTVSATVMVGNGTVICAEGFGPFTCCLEARGTRSTLAQNYVSIFHFHSS